MPTPRAGNAVDVTVELLVDRSRVADDVVDAARVALDRAPGAPQVVVEDVTAGDRGQALASALDRATGSVVVFVDARWGATAAAVVDQLTGAVAGIGETGGTIAVGQPSAAAAPSRTLPGGTVDVLLRPVAELLLPGLEWLRRPLDAPVALPRTVLAGADVGGGPAAGLDLILAVAARYGATAVVPVVLDGPWPPPPAADDPGALATAVLGVVLPRVTEPEPGPADGSAP